MITNEDYLAAYECNQLRKQVRFIKSSGVYMVKAHKPTQESDLTISNDEYPTTQRLPQSNA
jgi:hypothetical protein